MENKVLLDHITRYNVNIGAVKELIQKGADVNSHDDSSKSPLHFAAITNNFELVRLLINSGANINATDDSSMTPLHYAANNNIVQLLDFNGYITPPKSNEILMRDYMEALPKNYEIVSMLLRNGANVNMKDRYKKDSASLCI